MSLDIDQLLKEAHALVEQRRLIPALESFTKARQLTTSLNLRAGLNYNRGALFFHQLGNGEAARREFNTTASELAKCGYDRHTQLRLIHANATENAMLCALSFDEFDALAEQLRVLAPDMPIIAGLVPEVRAARARGAPWSNQLLDFAYRCYNRNDPSRDLGRYGQAKSTYHLLLAHRRELRLVREDWAMAIQEYCVLAMRMTSDCMKVRGGDDDQHSPEEFLPIVTEALPLIDEYLSVQSGDEDVRKFREDICGMITGANGRWAERSQLPSSSSPVRMRCRQCHKRITDPLQRCPACGSPSEVWATTAAVGFIGSLTCGSGVYLGLASFALWLRLSAALVAGVIVLLVTGPLVFQLCIRRMIDRDNDPND